MANHHEYRCGMLICGTALVLAAMVTPAFAADISIQIGVDGRTNPNVYELGAQCDALSRLPRSRTASPPANTILGSGRTAMRLPGNPNGNAVRSSFRVGVNLRSGKQAAQASAYRCILTARIRTDSQKIICKQPNSGHNDPNCRTGSQIGTRTMLQGQLVKKVGILKKSGAKKKGERTTQRSLPNLQTGAVLSGRQVVIQPVHAGTFKFSL